MTAREAAREAWKNLKDRPLKEKLEHIWTYYRIPILVGAVCIFIVCSCVFTAMAQKETALYGYCLNVSTNKEGVDAMTQAYMKYAGIDPNTSEVLLFSDFSTDNASSYDTMQTLTVHIAAKEVDFILSDEKTGLTMAQTGYCSDLTQMFTPEQQALLSAFYLYAERAALEADRYSDDTEKQPIVFAEKETLKDPVPVALRLPKALFDGLYTFSGESAVLVIPSNAPHVANLVSFLEFLLNR